MEDRFSRIMFGLFIAVLVGLVAVFCCSCCCNRIENKKPSPLQQGNIPKKKKTPAAVRVAIIIGFVALCYIVSFFVEGGGHKNPKYNGRGKAGRRDRGRGQDEALDIPAPPTAPTTEVVTITKLATTVTTTSTTTTTPTTTEDRGNGESGKLEFKSIRLPSSDSDDRRPRLNAGCGNL